MVGKYLITPTTPTVLSSTFVLTISKYTFSVGQFTHEISLGFSTHILAAEYIIGFH